MNKIIAAAVVSFATVATSAHAVTPTKIDPVKACFDRAQNQEQQARCYDQAITSQKKRLNAAYNKLVAHRKDDPKAIDALNQMQREWIKWRDSTIDYMNHNVAANGSTLQTVSNDFLLDAVTKQADLLESIRDMEGGE
ncbi:TPA: lysozyme inhibitor LprI family protein [Burkholderia cepacia]|uniref:lysozyme inhibitor LprI family protein n=1 Tax=Burkholderia cepacia TaxID=292 RepID=UPI001CF31F9C|nr:lysozyme inhibitor LprI family protein [Burkholderia cepacia]MCA8360894.1 lysozyme inhibitor LprI family protein [Burkholderia cepacia]HDR9759248.1 DUF1311 domain-containing protein [Burkholderia cepacia ATCC 25416]HDV6367844.1 DUF1311 domain-containing protein [Burkholderia cepacia]